MRKDFYIYNKSTLNYEKVKTTWKDRLISAITFVSAVAFASIGLLFLTHQFFPSPQEQVLIRENEQLQLKLSAFSKDFDLMSKVLTNIHERDGAAHRMIFGMDPVNEDVWQGGIGGHTPNLDLATYSKSGYLLSETQRKIDRLKHQLALQSKSLDTIANLAENRDIMNASIPSIKPIREDKLRRKIRHLSGYGMRVHPVHKVRKMHWGLDFTTPSGTPIYSTGDGTVERVENKKYGYGKNVIINHGFGYKTLYAHMSKIDVKRGEKITKGQIIGKVGSTGTSTAPHLHYEVIYKGKKVNPIHYCMDGLSPTEYKELVETAAQPNQSFD